MKAATIAMEIMLAICVLSSLICCLGMVFMEDLYERLHYMATVTTVSSFCLLMAVVLEEGWGQAAIKMCLIFLFLLFTNAVLTHATARAARVRTFGRWLQGPDGPIPLGKGLGERMAEEEQQAEEG
jgi:monovalent cation/proton antiporter MnhG/PhaG subunit